MDSNRTIRDREYQFPDPGPPPSAGPTTIAVQTVAVQTYPTSANAFYGVQLLEIGGPEVEGGQATMTPSGDPFYALNVGSGVPPAGTNLKASHVPDGRWAIQYDG